MILVESTMLDYHIMTLSAASIHQFLNKRNAVVLQDNSCLTHSRINLFLTPGFLKLLIQGQILDITNHEKPTLLFTLSTPPSDAVESDSHNKSTRIQDILYLGQENATKEDKASLIDQPIHMVRFEQELQHVFNQLRWIWPN